MNEYINEISPSQESIDFYSSFFKSWNEELTNKKYHSSQEIIAHIFSNNQNLKKKKYLWEQILDSNGIGVNLGYTHETALKQFLDAESIEDEQKRRISLLEFTYLYLVVNGRMFQSASIIAKLFRISEDQKIVDKSNFILKELEVNGFLHQLSDIKNGVIFGGAIGLNQLLKNKILIPLAGKGTQAFKFLTHKFAQIVNTPMKNAMLASLGVHSSIPILTSEAESTPETKDGDITISPYPTTSREGKLFWEKTKEKLSPNKDLYKQQREELLAMAKNYLTKKLVDEKSTHLDFIEYFLLLDKYYGFDDIDTHDFSVFEKAKTNMYNIVKTFQGQWQEQVSSEQIDQFRKYLFDWGMKHYIRDDSALTSLAKGKGGNCVAQTLFIVSLLAPFEERLPKGVQLAVQQFPDHIRPILYYQEQQTVYDLIYGTLEKKIKAPIFAIDYLVFLSTLKSDVKPEFTKEQFLLNTPEWSFSLSSFLPKSIKNLINRQNYRSALGGVSLPGVEVFNEKMPPEKSELSYRGSIFKSSSSEATEKKSFFSHMKSFFNNMLKKEDHYSRVYKLDFPIDDQRFQFALYHWPNDRGILTLTNGPFLHQNVTQENIQESPLERLGFLDHYRSIYQHQDIDLLIKFIQDPFIQITLAQTKSITKLFRQISEAEHHFIDENYLNITLASIFPNHLIIEQEIELLHKDFDLDHSLMILEKLPTEKKSLYIELHIDQLWNLMKKIEYKEIYFKPTEQKNAKVNTITLPITETNLGNWIDKPQLNQDMPEEDSDHDPQSELSFDSYFHLLAYSIIKPLSSGFHFLAHNIIKPLNSEKGKRDIKLILNPEFIEYLHEKKERLQIPQQNLLNILDYLSHHDTLDIYLEEIPDQVKDSFTDLLETLNEIPFKNIHYNYYFISRIRYSFITKVSDVSANIHLLELTPQLKKFLQIMDLYEQGISLDIDADSANFSEGVKKLWDFTIKKIEKYWPINEKEYIIPFKQKYPLFEK